LSIPFDGPFFLAPLGLAERRLVWRGASVSFAETSEVFAGWIEKAASLAWKASSTSWASAFVSLFFSGM
jgi:hypothetical protein